MNYLGCIMDDALFDTGPTKKELREQQRAAVKAAVKAAKQAARKTPREKLKEFSDQVMVTWNGMAMEAKLPLVKAFGDKRLVELEKRKRDKHWLEHWEEAIKMIPKQKFLLGINNRGWQATMDWFLRPESVNRILEGLYERCDSTQRKRGHVYDPRFE